MFWFVGMSHNLFDMSHDSCHTIYWYVTSLVYAWHVAFMTHVPHLHVTRLSSRCDTTHWSAGAVSRCHITHHIEMQEVHEDVTWIMRRMNEMSLDLIPSEIVWTCQMSLDLIPMTSHVQCVWTCQLMWLIRHRPYAHERIMSWWTSHSYVIPLDVIDSYESLVSYVIRLIHTWHDMTLSPIRCLSFTHSLSLSLHETD